MDEERITKAIEAYGFNPESIGVRHRSWYVIDAPDETDEDAGASAGDLCVEARDGGSNDIDTAASKYPNYIGSVQDWFDETYRYYYYRPLNNERSSGGEIVQMLKDKFGDDLVEEVMADQKASERGHDE